MTLPKPELSQATRLPEKDIREFQIMLNSNPFLKNTFLVNGAARAKTELPSQDTIVHMDQVTSRLIQIDPRYQTNDIDLAVPVWQVNPDQYQQIILELNDSSTVYSQNDTRDTLYTAEGAIITLLTDGRRQNGLTCQEKEEIFQHIVNSFPDDQKTNFYLRLARTTNHPYLLVGPNAADIVPPIETNPDLEIKSGFTVFGEIFLAPLDVSSIKNDTEVEQVRHQSIKKYFGNATPVQMLSQNDLAVGALIRPESVDYLNYAPEPDTPHNLFNLSQAVYSLYNLAINGSPPTPELTAWLNSYQKSHPEPLIGSTDPKDNPNLIRKIWRNLVRQMAFNPQVIPQYDQLGLIALFKGPLDNSIDLSAVPSQYHHRYQKEFDLIQQLRPPSSTSY